MKAFSKRYADLFLLGAMLVAMGVTGAKGYAITSPSPHMSEAVRNVVSLDSGVAAAMIWPSAGIGTTAPTPSNSQLLLSLSRVAQQWSMFGRGIVSVQMNPTAVSLPFAGCAGTPALCVRVDNTHGIIHGPLPWWLGSGTLGYGSCLNPSDCDIFLPDGDTYALLEDDVTPVGVTNSTVSFARNIGHEIGHLLGIAHPEPQNTNCAFTALSPLMCQTLGAGGVGMKWDHASADDVQGLRFVYGESQQAGKIITTTLSAGGAMSWTQENIVGLPNKLVTQPRIACQTGTGSPACVLAATTEDCDAGFPTCVTLYAIHPSAGAWNVVARTDLHNGAHNQVDIAFGKTGEGAVSVRSDSGDQRVWFAWWNLAQDTNVQQGTLSDANGNSVSHSMPRVTWHEGIDRCIIVYADRERVLWAATSQSAACKEFKTAVRIPFTDRKHHPVGLFDVACPAHEKPAASLVQADKCVVTMNEQTSAFNAPQNDNPTAPSPAQREALINSNMTACTFTVADTGALTAGSCATPNWADAMQVSISTARFGTGGTETPSWLSSVSRHFPTGTNNNTAQILALSPLMPTPAQALSLFNIPLSGVSRSDWGGLSCDFSEANHKVACVGLEPVGGGVAW